MNQYYQIKNNIEYSIGQNILSNHYGNNYVTYDMIIEWLENNNKKFYPYDLLGELCNISYTGLITMTGVENNFINKRIYVVNGYYMYVIDNIEQTEYFLELNGQCYTTISHEMKNNTWIMHYCYDIFKIEYLEDNKYHTELIIENENENGNKKEIEKYIILMNEIQNKILKKIIEYIVI